jgi:hypothetical protein
VASNTATANVLLPILADMSLTICQNPIYLVSRVILVIAGITGLPDLHTKNPNFGKFWRALEMKLFVYFTAIWNSWLFGF